MLGLAAFAGLPAAHEMDALLASNASRRQLPKQLQCGRQRTTQCSCHSAPHEAQRTARRSCHFPFGAAAGKCLDHLARCMRTPRVPPAAHRHLFRRLGGAQSTPPCTPRSAALTLVHALRPNRACAPVVQELRYKRIAGLHAQKAGQGLSCQRPTCLRLFTKALAKAEQVTCYAHALSSTRAMPKRTLVHTCPLQLKAWRCHSC
jgi:hypothetical protein